MLLGQVKQMEDGRVRTRFAGTMGTAVTTASGEVEVQFLPGSGLDEAAGLALLEQLGVTVEETGRSREGDMTTVLARQLWEGSPMPDAVVVMTLRGEELESLSFRRMVSTGEAPAAGETITAATALARQHGSDAVPYLVCGDRRLALAVCGGRRYRSGIGSG